LWVRAATLLKYCIWVWKQVSNLSSTTSQPSATQLFPSNYLLIAINLISILSSIRYYFAAIWFWQILIQFYWFWFCIEFIWRQLSCWGKFIYNYLLPNCNGFQLKSRTLQTYAFLTPRQIQCYFSCHTTHKPFSAYQHFCSYFIFFNHFILTLL